MPNPKPAPRLFDYEVDITGRIKACLTSGIDLSEGEQEFLRAFRFFKRPTQNQYRMLWEICSRCGVK